MNAKIVFLIALGIIVLGGVSFFFSGSHTNTTLDLPSSGSSKFADKTKGIDMTPPDLPYRSVTKNDMVNFFTTNTAFACVYLPNGPESGTKGLLFSDGTNLWMANDYPEDPSTHTEPMRIFELQRGSTHYAWTAFSGLRSYDEDKQPFEYNRTPRQILLEDAPDRSAIAFFDPFRQFKCAEWTVDPARFAVPDPYGGIY